MSTRPRTSEEGSAKCVVSHGLWPDTSMSGRVHHSLPVHVHVDHDNENRVDTDIEIRGCDDDHPRDADTQSVN